MVVCKYYQTGFCRFGDRCRFEHVDRVNYPNNQQRYPDQYVNRFPASNYLNNPVAVATGNGSGYNQRGTMVGVKKPEQYHYVGSVYDRQFQANGGQSYNHQSRIQHGHTGHSGATNINTGVSGSIHQGHYHLPHQQQHGAIPVQFWQVQQQHQQQQQRHQQMHPSSSNHHQSHSSNQRQAQVAHHGHGQGQSGGQLHPSGSGGQHHPQSAGFSFNQKLKEIESSQKPQVGFSFNRALQQIQHHQYQPHLAQQAQGQYYLTPTPVLTLPVQAPYYGATMPVPMVPNSLAPMFPSMLPTNNADPKMISSYLPQQPPQGKISMNLSDDDSGIYSIMSSLTPEELNQYKADKFTFPHIPINPPPKELCL